MDLIKILYQPYVICIYIAIIVTLISYFIIRKDNKDKNNVENKNNTKTLLYTFIASFLIAMILKYLLDYANTNKFFQKGGNKDITDHLTIVADDIEIGLI